MESMQCLSTLPNEQKIALLIWFIYCMFSVPLIFVLLHENNKLKTILKYKEFLGSDKNDK